ncbi:MAG: polyprenol monophosphomannose synthase [Bdellovibrionaceae bacterium]|nr:polyprenol monophosphomannose synthase [Pseudobdellovibrionaceae bacterium]MBX3033450.1 polyprenol monophosphomannose synthase [Pseudobdellovibrionaceae bacterium]
MKPLVIIPTYNEKDNIGRLIPEVLAQGRRLNILVVDDNSPDGTADVVRAIMAEDPRVHLLSRPGKQGLGKAYLAGFRWGLDNDYDVLVEMDADFSHRPADLGPLVDAVLTADFAVGSRYVRGGGTVNWGLMRKIISRGGGLYSRLILGFPLNDWTGGFNAWRRETLQAIGLDGVRSNGYSFQIELKYKALKNGRQGVEVPILFEDRRVGQSKMSLRIVLEAFYRVWLLRFDS